MFFLFFTLLFFLLFLSFAGGFQAFSRPLLFRPSLFGLFILSCVFCFLAVQHGETVHSSWPGEYATIFLCERRFLVYSDTIDSSIPAGQAEVC